MEITIRLLQAEMIKNDSKDGFLIDGFPRQLDQAKEFEKIIGTARCVLYYECKEDILEQRLLERGKTSGREDDNIDTIKKRFRTFLEASYPVIEYYQTLGRCITIQSDKTVDQVFEETKKKMFPFAHPNIIFVLGSPGSGKENQCTLLAKEFNLKHISTENLLKNASEKKALTDLKPAEFMNQSEVKIKLIH